MSGGPLCLSEVVATYWSGTGSATSQEALRLPEEILDLWLHVLCLFFLPGPGHFASPFSRKESSGRK